MKARIALVALALGALTALFSPLSHSRIVQAQATATPVSIESLGGQLGLPETDFKQVVIQAIKLVLSLMTLVAIVLVVYGGFVWLTSAGDETKIENAKKIISAALIGLVVILLSWALVIFTTRTATNVITDANSSSSF
jgi:amino acid transporter